MNLAERNLILSYAPSAAAAQALLDLLALDDKLADTLRTTSEPMLGQIRLQWWQDALAKLDAAPPPAEPVLEGITHSVLREGVTGAEVGAIVDGWQVLLDAELDSRGVAIHGVRGRTLFAVAGKCADADAGDPLALAGQGWALADLATKLTDAGEAELARSQAMTALNRACQHKWSRNGRALGAMAHLARMNLMGVPEGTPRRMLRVLWHRITGR